MEEAGQALLWHTGNENGAKLKGRNSSREAYEEVRPAKQLLCNFEVCSVYVDRFKGPNSGPTRE